MMRQISPAEERPQLINFLPSADGESGKRKQGDVGGIGPGQLSRQRSVPHEGAVLDGGTRVSLSVRS